jgi:hypothetical protein
MGKRVRLQAAVAAVAAVAAAMALAAPASASDVIGEAYGSSGGIPCSNGVTYIQAQSTDNRYAAPYDGVITSWTTDGFWDNATFKVARLSSGSSYDVVAKDGPRTTTFNVPATYAVRIPVRQGDVIGAYVPNPSNCTYTGAAGDTLGISAGDVTGPGSFDSTQNRSLPISAQIERDADNDGYGDETQDGCPGNASTHGACPLPKLLGQTFAPHNNSCEGGTVFPLQTPGIVSSVQTEGVITSWSYQANPGSTGTVQLKILQPLGGDQYLLRSQDVAHPVVAGLNTFNVRLSVRVGDRIAIATTGDDTPACGIKPSDWKIGSSFAPPAVGSSGPFATETGLSVDLAAMEEADADGDGYGDTTQDLCPTDPTTQGACATPPPPGDDKACEKARDKLAKAKAKLKKLKKHDAPAKKVKKAKAKVKKAKERVKKAC